MDIFSFLKKNISIETVVSEHTTLKRSGNYLKGRCPFHHEKTASFTISPGKDIFYCFGCHKGGDMITFVSLLENCSQKEAALLLAERYHIQLPQEKGTSGVQLREKRDIYYRLCAIVQRWLTLQYHNAPRVQNYVQSRGISKKIIERFGLGYFPKGKRAIQALLQHARQESILAKDLVEAKLLFLGPEGAYYSPFEDRLIIPISDALGRICGFGGRIFQEGDERAKYYNSHEHEFFDKSSVLFGLFQAKEYIKKEQSVFIVEGYMDCLMMVEHGYQNTVAVLGTACSESHLKQLSRYTDTMYVLYDGDDAGKNALLRLTEKCWRVAVDPLVLSLPQGEDPASYLEKYDSLNEVISQGKDIFSFFIFHAAAKHTQKTLHDKIQSIHSILEVIMHIDDPIKQTVLLSQASKAIGVSEETLKTELIQQKEKKELREQKNIPVEKVQESIQNETVNMVDSSDEECIDLLLGFMLQNPKHVDYFLVELCGISGRQSIQKLCKLLLDMNQKQEKYSFDVFWERLTQEEQQIVSQLIMQKGIEIDFVSFQKQAQQFERQMFKRTVNSLKGQIAESVTTRDEKKTEELLKTLVAMQKKFNQRLYRESHIV